MRHLLIALTFLLASASQAQAGSLFAKLGMGNYIRGMTSPTSVGFSWGATYNVQPISAVGFELSYEGSRNAFANGELADSAVLRNGGNAMLKLGIPLLILVKPFVAAGIGASYVSITGSNADEYRGGFGKEFPFAAGVEFNPGPLTTGIRATYRYLPDQNTSAFEKTAALVDVTATVGAVF